MFEAKFKNLRASKSVTLLKIEHPTEDDIKKAFLHSFLHLSYSNLLTNLQLIYIMFLKTKLC